MVKPEKFGHLQLVYHFTISLRKTASDNRSEYASDVTRILERSFSVDDDMLKSFQTATEAKDVTRKVKELYAKGGFNHTKFTSNSDVKKC